MYLWRKLFLALTILSLAGASVVGWAAYELNRPAGSGPKKEIVIELGTPVQAIASELEGQGLIRSAKLFAAYVRFKGLDTQIEAGRYEIPPSLSMLQVIEVLRHGTFDIRLTFLEGWRREEFLEYALERLPVDSESFSEEFLAETEGLEGYLFPDTYLVSQNITAKELVALLTDNFEEKYAEVAEAIEGQNISREQAVTIASLVEREASGSADAALISGIIIKRLSLGWPLDVDATIQYALGYHEGTGTWWKKNLTSADLSIDSPYNTRLVQGLPPGPICNPGLVALNAVANPQASDYLYYLHDKDGNIHYAKNLAGHNRNVLEYLK